MAIIGSNELTWYQAPQARATSPKHLEMFQRLQLIIEQRKVMLPDKRCEHVYDPVGNTINFAGHPDFFIGLADDFRQAGFDLREVSGDAMDQQQRDAFREMIINGGSYNG